MKKNAVTAETVSQGTSEIEQAKERVVKSRKKKLYCLMIMAITLFVVLSYMLIHLLL